MNWVLYSPSNNQDYFVMDAGVLTTSMQNPEDAEDGSIHGWDIWNIKTGEMFFCFR